MALTESKMMPLGRQIPNFSLPDVASGKQVSNADFGDQALLVMFICNHCPYVIHIAESLATCADQYIASGLAVVAISSNDADEYPADSPEKMKAEVGIRGYSFPYLYDATQQVAKDFTAACTPDFFLFDKSHKLVYRGRFDGTRPTRIQSGVYESDQTPTGDELSAAVTAVLAGEPVNSAQLPSLGCNIKWISDT